MNMRQLDIYRAEKDLLMRNGDYNINDLKDRAVEGQFGNMHGIDNNAHGAELE